MCFVYRKLTIAVQVLSDPVQRMVYDEIHGYSLTSINPFLEDSNPKDHVFVDEFSCIGSFTHSYNITLFVLVKHAWRRQLAIFHLFWRKKNHDSI